MRIARRKVTKITDITNIWALPAPEAIKKHYGCSELLPQRTLAGASFCRIRRLCALKIKVGTGGSL